VFAPTPRTKGPEKPKGCRIAVQNSTVRGLYEDSRVLSKTAQLNLVQDRRGQDRKEHANAEQDRTRQDRTGPYTTVQVQYLLVGDGEDADCVGASQRGKRPA